MPVPYDPDNIPESLKKRLRKRGLGAKGIRQFVHVFNSCWEKHEDKSRCYAQAYSVVKERDEYSEAAFNDMITRVVKNTVTASTGNRHSTTAKKFRIR